MQGESLGVDLARAGSLSGPGAAVGTTYTTEGVGGVIGGLIVGRAGSGLAALGKKFASDYTTQGVRDAFQKTANDLRRHLDQERARLNALRNQYRQDCF